MPEPHHVTASLPSTVRIVALQLVVVTLAASVLLISPASGRTEEVVFAPSGVAYVTGGVSSDAIDELKMMEKNFNLKLVFARTTGEYLSDVDVTIVDSGGRVLLDTRTDGPVLMTKLAAGGYEVDASVAGRTERRRVTIGPDRLATVDFRWSGVN